MFSVSYRGVTALAKCDRMNDFPVIGDPCFAHGIMGSPGGKHYESLQRNVWCGVVSPIKRSVFGQCRIFRVFMSNGDEQCWCVEMSSFCVINAINSIDEHSLREVECEIYGY